MKRKLIVRISVVVFSAVVGVVLFVCSRNQSEQLLEKIIAESDCCVCLSSIGGGTLSSDNGIAITDDLKFIEKENNVETSVEKIVGLAEEDAYFPDFEVTLVKQYENGKSIIEYADEFVCEKISDIRPLYILFLSKSDDGDYYYITGGKSGAIKITDDSLEPLDKNLKFAVWLKFENDYGKFEHWRVNEYEFSDNMIPVEATRVEFDINNMTIPYIDYSNIETTAAP